MMLLIDIGGSMTRVSAEQEKGVLLPPLIFPTEPDIDAGIARISHAARTLLSSEEPHLVVAGIAGQVTKDGVLRKGPNLPLWEGHDIREKLSREFGAPSYVANDAVLGAMGEAHDGAGRNASVLLYMTFGTGIGAARVIDGKPDFTIGTETGHQFIWYGETLIEAEDLVSGRALKQKYGATGETLRDPKLWKEHARLAAVALYNTCLHLLPDTVVLGGSLMKEGSLSSEDIELRLAEIGRRLSPLPKVIHGTLGDIVGLHGARAYAKILAR